MAALSQSLSRCIPIRPLTLFRKQILSQSIQISKRYITACVKLQPTSTGQSWRHYCSSTVTEPSGNYRYSESHEWALLDGTTATVGISNYAQDKLGEAVFIDVPDVNDEVTGGEPFGAVESVKAAADLNSPLSGSVAEINEELVNEPTLINSDPYDKGWVIKINVSDSNEYDKLMSSEEYAQFLKDGQ